MISNQMGKFQRKFCLHLSLNKTEHNSMLVWPRDLERRQSRGFPILVLQKREVQCVQ